jgi:HrpA-like RNA helicase
MTLFVLSLPVGLIRYDPSTGVRSLVAGWISKASAEQRKGRAGRTGPGHCYRLYSEQDFEEHFPSFTRPEVTRMNLDATLLQILATGMDPRDFPFIEPPSEEAMGAALLSLEMHGATVEVETWEALSSVGAQPVQQQQPPPPPPQQPGVDGEVEQRRGRSQLHCTALGRALSTLPVDIAAGKMLLLSTVFEQVGAVPAVAPALLTITAALSIQSPLQKLREGLSSRRTAGGGADPGNEPDETSVDRLREHFISKHGEPRPTKLDVQHVLRTL